jgi:hypothetical protein
MQQQRSEKVIILVHPGSLCGSYETIHDWHAGWKSFARAQRELICFEVIEFQGTKIVVLGTDLDDEIPFYPCVDRAVKAATETFRAEPEGGALHRAARQIWEAHRRTAADIRVTGCWCDAPDGCAWTLYDELRKIAKPQGVKVTLDREGACESDIDELQGS